MRRQKKRVKRVFPRSYQSSICRAPHQPDRSFMREIYYGGEYFQKSLVDDAWMVGLFDESQSLNSTEKIVARAVGANGVPRAIVLRKLMQAQNGISGEVDFKYVVFIKEPEYELRMFFCGDIYFFTKKHNGLYWKSEIYPSKEKAKFAYIHSCICWKYPPYSPPNSG